MASKFAPFCVLLVENEGLSAGATVVTGSTFMLDDSIVPSTDPLLPQRISHILEANGGKQTVPHQFTNNGHHIELWILSHGDGHPS